jgi:ubiquinone/menaquinone biosynthesis C-methylase UbiE
MTHVGDRKEVRWFNDVSTSYRREYDRETTDGFSFRMRRDKVAAVLPEKGAGKTVLDIACGPGVMVAPLTKRGYHVTSVDAAPEMIARAKEEHGGNPLADFAVGDVYHLNYPDATFDSVIAMGLVEYLDDEPRAFSEMARVLKPGGLLIVSFPNYWAPWRIWSRFVMFLTSLPRRLYKRLTGNPGHYITHREYTLRTAKAWFTHAGVTPTRAWYYNFKLIPWPLDQALPRITVAQSKLCESLDTTPLRSLGTGFNLSGTKS